MKRKHDAGYITSAIIDLAASDALIGKRMKDLDLIIHVAMRERHRLSMQLGVDVAKELFAAGVQPTGEPMTPERWEQMR